MTNTNPHITIRDVSKTYPSPRGNVTALTDVTMDIRKGEFLSLLGPSGCGKSTLLQLIAGLTSTSTGTMQLGGKTITEPPLGLGMAFQRDTLLDWRNVLQNVMLPVEMKRLKGSEYKDRAIHLLTSFGLKDFLGKNPWELSGGMRQRVAICRALVTDPELLLMDEPFGALDALTRDELNLELQEIWLKSGKTIVFVTHSIAEAIFLSDRVSVMAARPGRVVETLDVQFPRSRALSIRETPEFAVLTRRVREIFENNGVFTNEH